MKENGMGIYLSVCLYGSREKKQIMEDGRERYECGK